MCKLTRRFYTTLAQSLRWVEWVAHFSGSKSPLFETLPTRSPPPHPLHSRHLRRTRLIDHILMTPAVRTRGETELCSSTDWTHGSVTQLSSR